jgi:3-deoxy-D-manno-octulosonate 8-phosphate phosphatase (KDO 8-P phosphatase)
MPSWNIDEREGIKRAGNITWLVMDVDGVLTDGTIYVTDMGHEIKGFYVQDGHGIKLWQRTGRHTAVITGRSSTAVTTRCADLGIDLVYQAAKVKTTVYQTFLQESGAAPAQVCFIGDDLVDLPVFREIGLAATVADAVAEVRDEAHLVTSLPGGRGAVREIIDFLLKLQGAWEEATHRYYQNN